MRLCLSPEPKMLLSCANGCMADGPAGALAFLHVLPVKIGCFIIRFGNKLGFCPFIPAQGIAKSMRMKIDVRHYSVAIRIIGPAFLSA